MHCIVPCEKMVVDGFRQGLTKLCPVLYRLRVGKSMGFDMDLPKIILCIVPSESREVEGARQGPE